MGQAELRTVSAARTGKGEKLYSDKEESRGHVLFTSAGSVLALSLAYIKDMLFRDDTVANDGARQDYAVPHSKRSDTNAGAIDETGPVVGAAGERVSRDFSESVPQPDFVTEDDGGNSPYASDESPSSLHSAHRLMKLVRNDNDPLPGSAHARMSAGPFAPSTFQPREQRSSQMPSSTDKPMASQSARQPGKAPRTDDPVQRINRSPIVSGPVPLDDLLVNQSIVIAMSQLLSRASDADSDRLSVTDLAAQSGELHYNGDGTWTFAPAVDDDTSVLFTYGITDGISVVAESATLDLVHGDEVIFGTMGDDVLVGTPMGDVVDAGGGSDTVTVGSGNDVVSGGGGDDIIYGGAGNDVIIGGAGNDVLFGDDGNDTIHGGAGNDFIFGGRGNDLLIGDAGNDVIFGDDGDDTIAAGDGDDVVYGGTGKDHIDGGTGNNTLIGGAEEDVVNGGSGKDRFVATTDDGNDSYDGGGDVDTYDASSTKHGIVADLKAGQVSGSEIGQDRVTRIENVVGGAGDDTIIADADANTMTGGDGRDTFAFLAAEDTPATPEKWDQIRDFSVGDRIDVSKIDANKTSEGVQAFKFVGEAAGSETVGEIHFKHEHKDDSDHTFIIGHVDPDMLDDFVIDLIGMISLTVDDFNGVYA